MVYYFWYVIGYVLILQLYFQQQQQIKRPIEMLETSPMLCVHLSSNVKTISNESANNKGSKNIIPIFLSHFDSFALHLVFSLFYLSIRFKAVFLTLIYSSVDDDTHTERIKI